MPKQPKAPEPTSWGGVADWYYRLLYGEQSTFQKDVIAPNLARLMDIQKGDVVVDLACGPGFFSREFAKAGARVLAADISEELIAAAREHINKNDGMPESVVRFDVAPAENMAQVQSGSADKVVIVLAIQNIANLNAVFAECRRMLKPSGHFFVVLNHPAFRVPKQSAWGWDADAQTQYRRVDRYLGEFPVKIAMHPGSAPSKTTVSFHRPLQSYFKALDKSGFAVRRLEEWISHKHSDSGPRAKAENISRKEFPLFLCLEAIPRV